MVVFDDSHMLMFASTSLSDLLLIFAFQLIVPTPLPYKYDFALMLVISSSSEIARGNLILFFMSPIDLSATRAEAFPPL